MDKITKNPDAKFTSSPRASNAGADSQIDKYMQDVSRKNESDFINTRKLTVQPSAKYEPTEASEIDKQISDLECLIKRLQDEIVEMSNNVDKPTLPDNDKPTFQTQESEGEEFHEVKKTINPIDSADLTNHAYPVVLKDIGYAINDQSEKFAAQVSDLVNFPASSSAEANADDKTVPKTFSSIRRDIGGLWIDENVNNDRAGENKAKEDDFHLQRLIGELKSDINEGITSASNRSNDGVPLNNSKENLKPSVQD